MLHLHPSLRVFISFIIRVRASQVAFVVLVLRGTIVLVMDDKDRRIHPFTAASSARLVINRRANTNRVVRVTNHARVKQVMGTVIAPARRSQFRSQQIAYGSQAGRVLLL